MGDALPSGHPLRNAGGKDPTAVTVRAGMPEPRLEVSGGPRAGCTSLREKLSHGGVAGRDCPGCALMGRGPRALHLLVKDGGFQPVPNQDPLATNHWTWVPGTWDCRGPGV